MKRILSWFFAVILIIVQAICPDYFKSGLEWQGESMTVFEPTEGGVYYPRIYHLSDGTLLCGFTLTGGGKKSRIVTVRSEDNGKTWSKTPIVASVHPELNCDNVNFFELPSGELLLAYRAVLSDESGTYTSLRVAVSTDKGYTWSEHSLITECRNSTFNGVWEPHLEMIDGKLLVFYANDSLAGDGVTSGDRQNIEYRIYDGAKWTDKYIVSSGEKTRSRDGMPVITKLRDGGYAIAIEGTRSVNPLQNPKNGMFIKLLISEDGFEWDETKAVNVYYPKDVSRVSAAPYIVTLPDGRVAVSYQTDDCYPVKGDLPKGQNFDMKVSVSLCEVTKDTSVMGFTKGESVFSIPEGFCAIWNSMAVIGNQLYCVSSSNYGGSKIILRISNTESR
ncbi:MAG: exo-alpha-sialidase [Clostridia bacterium]|nr:exo-alpha-sialidase [Clostridia bacterium]